MHSGRTVAESAIPGCMNERSDFLSLLQFCRSVTVIVRSLRYEQIGITVMHLGRFYTKSEWLTTMLAVQVGTADIN